MIDSSAPVEQPVADAPPADVAPDQPVEQATAPVADVDDDPLEPEIAAQVIDIPDGDKLVPLSALKGARTELKTLKQAAKDTPALKAALEQAQKQLEQTAPMVEAFKAWQQAQQYQPPVQQPQAPPVEDTTDLEDLARTFDFYKPDGTVDLDKARKVQAHTQKQAESIAQQYTTPLVTNVLEARVNENLGRAMATAHPVTGEKADPQILNALVQQIRQQPDGLKTLSNPEAMKQIWLNAYSLSTFKQKPAAAAAPAKEAVAPPLVTERAGGQIQGARTLSSLEKRAAKDAGMTEAEYLAEAKKMPW